MICWEEKIQLAERIKKIKDDTTLKEIYDIIHKENPQLEFTKTLCGAYCYFHQLTEQTYDLLIPIVDTYFKNRRKRLEIKLHIPKSTFPIEIVQ